MTILEKVALDIVVEIVTAKMATRREPTHALFLDDHLGRLVVDRCGLADQFAAERFLAQMVIDGLLVSGPTIRDTYYALPPKEFDSSL